MTPDLNKEPHEVSFETPRFIRCPDCGEEIPMVPVLAQMIEAIENHISTHRVHGETTKEYFKIQRPEQPHIRQDLTVQVLQRAAEIGGSLSRNPPLSTIE